MKRVSIFVVFIVSCVCLMAGGLSLCAGSNPVAYAERSSQIQEVDGVNYNNFDDPRMLAADTKSNFLYLIDRMSHGVDIEDNELSSFHIVVIDRSNGRTVSSAVEIENPSGGFVSANQSDIPRQIKLESDGTNSYVFIFYPRRFMVFAAKDLAEGNYNPIKLNGNEFIPYKAGDTELPSFGTHFFNVHFRNQSQGFVLIWGRASTFRFTYYTITAAQASTSIAYTNAAADITSRTLTPPTNETSIDGIVYDTKIDGFYIAYSAMGQARFFRNRNSTPTVLDQLSPEIFTNVSSMHYLSAEDKFVFLSYVGGERITWFSPTTGEFDFVELRNVKTFHPGTTDRPVFVYALSATEIFVIDGNNDTPGSKKSIDQYQFVDTIGEPRTIKFSRIVAATWGDEDGFYYFPSAMTIINQGHYIVADNSGQIAVTNLSSGNIPQPFSSETETKGGSAIISMVYDNFKHVYTFDLVNGIRKFTLGGVLAETFAVDSLNRPFGKITQLIAAPDQSIYALDIGTGAANSDRIYRYNGTAFVEIAKSRSFKIVTETRGEVHDSLNALVLTSANFSGTKACVSLDLASTNYTTAGITLNALNAASDSELVLDIVFDVLGDAITLVRITQPNETFKYELRRFELQISPTVSFIRVPEYAFDSKLFDEMEVYALNACLNLDKLNSRLYFLGANHAIEYIDLRADLWTFSAWRNAGGQWSATPRTKFEPSNNKTPWQTAGQPSNFAKASKDIPIYDYPSALFASLPTSTHVVIEKNGIMKILEQTATIDYSKASEQTFAYRYVMYESRNRVHYGYVRASDIEYTDPSEDPDFLPENRDHSGRTIYDRTRIYQYPTADNSFILGYIKRNYNGMKEGTNIEGLPVRFITVPDQRGRTYYEIKISPIVENGMHIKDDKGVPLYSPDPRGSAVGYVSKSGIIDYRRPESTETFVSNATVTSHSTQVQVYLFDGSTYTPIENEFLADKTAVKVHDKAHLKRQYTYVSYVVSFEDGASLELTGHVESRYLTMNGITLVQILAFSGIIIAVLLVIGLIVWRVKRGKSYRTFRV